MLQKRVNLFGLFIDDVSMDEAVDEAENALDKNGGQRVFFTPNLEILNGARQSEAVRKIINSASISLPDGIGLRVVAFLVGAPLKNTVPGIDFGENLLSLAEKTSSRVFLLGAKDGIAQKAAHNLKMKMPNLNICGTHHGYFTDDEIDSICDKINESGAQILIVCRGFPKQEKFVLLAKNKLPNIKIFACLGGSLDVWSGKVKRAPALVQEMHLEWLWRILLEPERAERLFLSLPTIVSALRIFLNKNRIIIPSRAYNQTDTLGR